MGAICPPPLDKFLPEAGNPKAHNYELDCSSAYKQHDLLLTGVVLNLQALVAFEVKSFPKD